MAAGSVATVEVVAARCSAAAGRVSRTVKREAVAGEQERGSMGAFQRLARRHGGWEAHRPARSARGIGISDIVAREISLAQSDIGSDGETGSEGG